MSQVSGQRRCLLQELYVWRNRHATFTASAPKPVEFKDVLQNAYFYNPIMRAVENKVTSGTGDGTTFEPNANCTCGQVITFLYRAYK